jgi:hypothetical protein
MTRSAVVVPKNRNAPASATEPGAASDETIYWLMLAAGLVPVSAAVLRGGSWGVGPTVGGLSCVLSVRALLSAGLAHLRDRWRGTS